MESGECFLCSTPATVKLNISNTTTRHQKIPINSILDAFAGHQHIEIVITNTDSICLMCKLLLDELDCMRFKVQNIEQTIARKLHRKYQFDAVECGLPAIRLDEQTTKLYGCGGKSAHKFQCTKCAFSTDFQDCLFPHCLYHQCADGIEGNKAIDGAVVEDFPCESCQLILPTGKLFQQHMTMFHASVDTEIVNKQIDTSDHVDDVDCTNEETFQCKVSVFATLLKKSFKNQRFLTMFFIQNPPTGMRENISKRANLRAPHGSRPFQLYQMQAEVSKCNNTCKSHSAPAHPIYLQHM